jgi:hypothetical protein
VPEASVAAAAGNRAKVFVSYSRKDLAFAQMMVDVLAKRGFDAFLDKKRLAARSIDFLQQSRRRAGGAGQLIGCADIPSGEPRRHGPLGEVRSRQCQLAARLGGLL